MEKIIGFNTASCKDIGEMVSQTLDNLGKELGIKFNYKGGSFSPTSFTFKIKADILNAAGVNEADKQFFGMYAEMFGLLPEDYGKTVRLKRSLFKIIGIAPNSWKYPILVENVASGKVWKYPASTIQFLLGRTPKTLKDEFNISNLPDKEIHYNEP